MTVSRVWVWDDGEGGREANEARGRVRRGPLAPSGGEIPRGGDCWYHVRTGKAYCAACAEERGLRMTTLRQ